MSLILSFMTFKKKLCIIFTFCIFTMFFFNLLCNSTFEQGYLDPWHHRNAFISTTNLAACVSSKFDQFLPVRFYFVSKRPENFVRIAKFPYAAFGPLFAFHCPLFDTKNNNLGWNRHASPHTGTCRCNDHGPTVLSARGQ